MRGKSAESILESQLVLISAQLLRLSLGLSVTFLLVRELDDEAWSAFVVLSTAFALMAQVVDAGLQPALVAELAAGRDHRDGFVRRILNIRLLISFLALASCLIFPELLPEAAPLLVVGLVVLSLPLRTWNALFAAARRNRVTAVGGLGIHVLFLLSIVVALRWAANPLQAILLALCGREFSLSLYPFLRALSFRSQTEARASSLAPGRLWLLSSATIMGAAYLYVDVFMLEAAKGAGEVGSYGLATRLVIPVMVAANLMSSPYVPFLARRFEKRGRLAVSQLVALSCALLGCLLPAVVCFESGGAVVALIRGSADPVAGDALRILALVPVAVVLASIASLTLVVTKQYGTWALATGLGLATNILLNALWIPEHGSSGAAFATLITEFLVAVLAWTAIIRKRDPEATENSANILAVLTWSLLPSLGLLVLKFSLLPFSSDLRTISFCLLAMLVALAMTFFGPAKSLRRSLEAADRSLR